jgi:hypothetical protein
MTRKRREPAQVSARGSAKVEAVAKVNYARKRTPKGLVKPVPNKFLVPFLEQASLEDPDSEIIELWTNLFVSAAEQFSSYHVHFVSVIGRLTASQGEAFTMPPPLSCRAAAP